MLNSIRLERVLMFCVLFLSSAGKGLLVFLFYLFVLNLGRLAESTGSQGESWRAVSFCRCLGQEIETSYFVDSSCGTQVTCRLHVSKGETAEQPVHSEANETFKLNCFCVATISAESPFSLQIY